MSGRRLRSFPLCIIGLFGVYHGVLAWFYYDTGRYQYSDLTVINDWLTNAVFEGRPFYITDEDRFHLPYNFTPSLLLAAPLFWIFESQFILPALNVIAVQVSLFFGYRIFQELRPEMRARDVLLIALLLVFLGNNKFTQRILITPHFEILYAPFAVALVYVLLKYGAHKFTLWAALLCVPMALGLRQDAGLYLAFHMAGVCVLRRPERGRVFAAAGIAALALVYVAVSVKVIMPSLGYEGGLRFWKHYGGSAGEILAAFWAQRGQIFAELKFSGFYTLNESFSIIHLASPYTLFANAPALPLHFVDPELNSRRLLGGYVASLAWPGFVIAVCAGLSNVLWIADRVAAAPKFPAGRWFRWGAVAMLVVILGLGIRAQFRDDQNRHGDVRYGWHHALYGAEPRRQDFQRTLTKVRHGCAGIRSVAADHLNIVFVPNSLLKYTWRNPGRADVVVYDRRVLSSPPGPLSAAELLAAVEGAGYRVLLDDEPFVVYGRPGLSCELLKVH